MFCYQVTEGQDGHDDDGRCRGDLLGLDHGQHLRHLAFPEEKKNEDRISDLIRIRKK